MTDKEKIEAVFDSFGVVTRKGRKTIKTRDRRFVFDEEGVLVRIQEMIEGSWLTISEEVF